MAFRPLDALLAAARAAGLPPPEDLASLEAAVLAKLAAAREAWPTLDVPAEAFAAQLGASVKRLDAAALDELPTNDLFLAVACARGDSRALRELEAMTFGRARAELHRMRLSEDEITEALQALRERLFVAPKGESPKILKVALYGDLAGVIRVAAVRTALNLKRRDARTVAADDALVDALSPGDDPELAFLKRDQRALFKACVEEALAALEPKERNVLRMHLVHGLSIDEIGAAYRAHRATAARWLNATRERLDQEVRRLAMQKAGMTEPELESLVRLADSGFYVSVKRMLETRGAS